MPQSSRVFTNKDLIQDKHPPDILDDNPENIMDSPPDIMDEELSVESTEPQSKIVPNTASDKYWHGVVDSIMSGDALDASKKGAKGFLKGAVDFPSTIKGMIDTVSHPIESIKNIPSGLRQMYQTTLEAGANPEAFGRMMGQSTGQPLLTAGLVKAAPGTIRTMGKVVEPTGRIMRRYAPMTGMPVISPFAGRNMIRAERAMGRGVEAIGKKMKSVGKSNKTELPPDVPKKFKVIKNEVPEKIKPEVKLNRDGTYTRKDTGEIVDAQGNRIIEIDGKPITKDSPFFIKNRS